MTGLDELPCLLKQHAQTLTEAGVTPGIIVNRARVRSRWWFTKHDRFLVADHAWPLGVLLLTPAATLYGAGETVRGVAPAHPTHVSVERERRRALTSTAYDSGFTRGETLFVNTTLLNFDELDTTGDAGPLTLQANGVSVRWNPRDPHHSPRPLAGYLEEQVALVIERHRRAQEG